MLPIGDRIKLLRKKNHLTQRKLAEIIGVTEVSLQRFEYGTARPSLDTLILLADHFSCSIDFLVGRSDDPKRY